MTTIIDLRLEYKKETGDPYTPITHGYYDAVEYVLWLEEKVIALKKLKQKLIPFENEL